MSKVAKESIEKMEPKEGKNIVMLGNRKRVYTINKKPSMTDQSYKNEADSNMIMAKYKKTGELPKHIAKIQGQFADVSEVQNLLEGKIKLQQAEEEFLNIPSLLRKKFDNKFENMLAYLNDPANDKEAIELGLKVERENAEPVRKSEPASPSPAPASKEPEGKKDAKPTS